MPNSGISCDHFRNQLTNPVLLKLALFDGNAVVFNLSKHFWVQKYHTWYTMSVWAAITRFVTSTFFKTVILGQPYRYIRSCQNLFQRQYQEQWAPFFLHHIKLFAGSYTHFGFPWFEAIIWRLCEVTEEAVEAMEAVVDLSRGRGGQILYIYAIAIWSVPMSLFSLEY